MTELLQEYVRRQAEMRPEAAALVMDHERIGYADLEDWSNRLARLLEASGCQKGDRVCLLVPKAPTSIVAMIAALKAGCLYVPIDVSSPAPRVAKIVRAADPHVVLLTGSTQSLLDNVLAHDALGSSVVFGSMDTEPIAGRSFRCRFARSDWEAFAPDAVVRQCEPSDAAHLLFTSGSTGTPKAVVITHANVIAFIEWAVSYFGIAPSDRVSGHPPLHFDLSTFDIYGAVAAGAELHLVPAEMSLIPGQLARLIRSAELTQWFSVPSTMTYMAKFGVIVYDDFPSLKRVVWCGEVLPTPILVHWMERVTHARFTNLYGPTEATIASSYYTVPRIPVDETEPIPIGTACPGEELLVLDPNLEPVPPGTVGDLYIAGLGLSPGYWRDEDKTRVAFVPDPRVSGRGARIYKTGDLASIDEAGLIHFVGRADTQIKSRGYRIELGEIETALMALQAVRECAVIGLPSVGFEGISIACAFAPVDGPGDALEVKTRLREVLPTYMLPTRWMVLPELPKNANGKIDRRRLRELFSRSGAPADSSGRAGLGGSA